MSAFTWKEAYSVGIETIDDQHKKWISIINDLYVAHRQGTSQVIINDVISNLLDYTQYHFSEEESLMEKLSYSVHKEHNEEHQDFIRQVSSLKNESSKGNLLLSLKTIDLLKDWTITHILGTDREFGDFLKKKNIT